MSFLSKMFTGGKSNEEQQRQAVATADQQQEEVPSPPATDEADEAPIQLTLDDILLDRQAADKTEALKIISQRMLESGYVSEDYTTAMLERDAKVSTYLINGVAIPHGTVEAKHLVARTGIVVAQFPHGVEWSDKGDIVKLAVGIAASGNAHLKILTQLTNVVMDEALSTHLGEEASAEEIAEALGQRIESSPTVAEDFALKGEARIVDEAGMHARPASLISETAANFIGTDVRLRNGERMANAKSMAEILAMGATTGDAIVVSASGEQAEAAIDELVALINAGLDSVDDAEGGFADYDPLEALPPLVDAQGRAVFKGAAASPGIAVAAVHVFEDEEQQLERRASDVPEQLALLEGALAKAGEQLDELRDGMEQTAQNEAAIFKAQKSLLRDDAMLGKTRELISEGNTAAWSWRQSVNAQVEALEQVDDERIKGRTADMRDVACRVISILENKRVDYGFPQDQPFVLVARELTPSQTACLDSLPVEAICTELGGPNSHMAILARALGIPAIVGIGDDVTALVQSGEVAVVDPQSASFIVSPDEQTVTRAQEHIAIWGEVKAKEEAQKFEKAITVDGREVELVCNIAATKDAAAVLENGGEGVGLLRTEFMFESSSVEPSVEQQVDALREIASTLGSRRLIVRTADIGGDKPVSWLDMPHEQNPFLGVRGIRHSFQHETMFRHQLEAIYRVASEQVQDGGESGIHILFPMIAKLSELRKAKQIAEQVRAEVGAPELPLGIMVEVPSAALLAEHFAQEVDFFSVGSNDLTQYTLAMDRLHPDLAAEADSFNPALLRLIAMTVQAAEAHGKWVGVCGNMAADPDLAAILIGLGVNEISVSPANVPALKMLIRSVSYARLKAKAQRALSLGSSSQIKSLYEDRSDLV